MGFDRTFTGLIEKLWRSSIEPFWGGRRFQGTVFFSVNPTQRNYHSTDNGHLINYLGRSHEPNQNDSPRKFRLAGYYLKQSCGQFRQVIFRTSLMSVKIFTCDSRAGNGCANFMSACGFFVLYAGKPPCPFNSPLELFPEPIQADQRVPEIILSEKSF